MVLDGTPEVVEEPVQSPSIVFRCPSSQGSSTPESDLSVAGSVIDDDDAEDDGSDGCEAYEPDPSAVEIRSQSSPALIEVDRAVDEDAHRESIHGDPLCSAENGAGTSQNDPIDLEYDASPSPEVIEESDTEAPIAITRDPALVNVPEQIYDEDLPYNSSLSASSQRKQPERLKTDMDENSSESVIVEDGDMSLEEEVLQPTHEGATSNNKDEDEAKMQGRQIRPYAVGSSQGLKSTYDDPADKDDVSSSVAETEDEAWLPEKVAIPGFSNGTGAHGSAKAMEFPQVQPQSVLLVEDSQAQNLASNITSTMSMFDVRHKFHLIEKTASGHSNISERAPSPSDAAMAKTSTAKNLELLPEPVKRYSSGQPALNGLQSTHDQSALSLVAQAAIGTRDSSRCRERVPFVPYKYPNPSNVDFASTTTQDAVWEPAERHHAHYSDGPFSLHEVPVFPPSEHSDGLADFFARNKASILGASNYSKRVMTGSSDRYLGRAQVSQNSFRPGNGSNGCQLLHEDMKCVPNVQRHQSTIISGNRAPDIGFQAAIEDKALKDSLPVAAKTTCGFSIDDIVEKRPSEASPQIIGNKRKADEISSNLEDLIFSPLLSQPDGTQTSLEKGDLPDAQPRDVGDLLPQPTPTQSQDSLVGQSPPTAPMVDQEIRPKKRAKTIAKWIGTTILIGVGAIATISATAPQSLWDEVEREMNLM